MVYRHVGLKDRYWQKKVARLKKEGKLELVDTIESDRMGNHESTFPHPDNFKNAVQGARTFADLNLQSKIDALGYEPAVVVVKDYKEGSMSYEFWATAVAEVYRAVDK